MTSTIRRTLLKRLIGSGIQITPDALEYILELEEPIEAVDSIIIRHTSENSPPVLSQEHLKSVLQAKPRKDEDESIITPDTPKPVSENNRPETGEPRSEDPPWDIRVIMSPDSESVGSGGTVEDFLDLFNDRFKRIKRIYMRRIDTKNSISTLDAQEMKNEARHRKALRNGGRRTRRTLHKVIGIVKNKRISRSRNVIVEIEDSEGDILCVVPGTRKGLKGKELLEKGNALLLDEVICLSGHIDQDGRMIANDVIFPDIPTGGTTGRADRTVYAAFISDLHYGSKEFLENDFDHFIDWLRGIDVDSSEKRVIQNIRYLFVAGDLVDGIGVYPNQRDDLLIPDIYEQYAQLASKLQRIPERVKIVCIPGNHDACRKALPKPPIPREFAGPLYDFGNQITMCGDPCQVVVEGVKILITHGDSLDDLVTAIPGVSYKAPAEPMKHLLKKRHLAPLYGGKTQIAPLSRDWMVIDTPPDIVHFGHAHHNAMDNYRGIQIVNSGTFQAQTEFMRKQGIEPTPGIVSLINLRTGAPDVKVFHDYD